MALRATPTIAICLTAGIAGGIALARPADRDAPAAATPVAAPAEQVDDLTLGNDSPYLVDAPPPEAGGDAAAADADTAAPAPTNISIEGFAFSDSGSVAAGSPIAVTNLDSAPHTLTARDGAFDTGQLNQDEAASIAAPAAPGTYEFFCEIHPSMTGQLVVA